MYSELKVVELFAGVGGFRLGLDCASGKPLPYHTVWANQYEPTTTRQHAAEVYRARFGATGFSNQDIEKVIEHDFASIPHHDLLVGGFPCQDYSVATTLKNSHGLIGKKGVLFWSIYTILQRQGDHAPRYLFLENVDRLLKSPARQRGKDFAVMLAALADLGYAIEWRVVNAADYGLPQRRRRLFIVGYRQGTPLYAQAQLAQPQAWLTQTGVLASAFPVQPHLLTTEVPLLGSYADITQNFSKTQPALSPFANAGLMLNRQAFTGKITPHYAGHCTTLGELLVPEPDVSPEFFIPTSQLPQWAYLKGAKKEQRQAANGHIYTYSEGAMVFPDPLDKPSRTIITGEGGPAPSRFKHVILTPSGRYRRLVPVELERLNMFPDQHTELNGISASKRAFLMGNALVVGAIEQVGRALAPRC